MDGNWYYPDGRPYTTSAQPLADAAQPYLAVDGKWYYPDGRPYTAPAVAAQPAANAGQPYQAVDGNWYYPDGRPYANTTTAAARPAAPTSTTAAAPSSPTATAATPAANVIPDLERPAAVANNLVRTRLPAARSTLREELAQELSRSIEEGIDRLESSLRAALFSEADEAAFLGIYKRSFTEDTPQFRLARKNIKYLDADELRQGLIIDQIVDAGAQLYPSKLEISARFGAFKREVLGGAPPPSSTRHRKPCSRPTSGSLDRPNSPTWVSRIRIRSERRCRDCVAASRSDRNWPRRERRQAGARSRWTGASG